MLAARPTICALDESEASRHALRAATWLARELDAPLVLVHVFDPMGIPTLPLGEMAARSISDEDLERTARAAAHRLLEGAAQAVTGLELHPELREGRPVPELQRVASERRAALLVTGTAGRGGLDHVLIGSVASELATHAPCPLVAVPRGAALEEPGPVVTGYDGSEHSLRAARHAAALSARLGRNLELLHVARRGHEEDVSPGAELARELYAAAVAGLGDDPGRPALDLKVRVVVEDGDPVQVLAGFAAERAAALIVTGTRGRNPLSTALLGSVSAGLVQAARRPVAVVPASAGETPSAG